MKNLDCCCFESSIIWALNVKHRKSEIIVINKVWFSNENSNFILCFLWPILIVFHSYVCIDQIIISVTVTYFWGNRREVNKVLINSSLIVLVLLSVFAEVSIIPFYLVFSLMLYITLTSNTLIRADLARALPFGSTCHTLIR